MREKILKPFIIQVLRRSSYRWWGRSEAIKLARVERGLYKCANCKENFPRKEIQIDHINPVVSTVDGFTTWDEYINRMFVNPEDYQAVCKPCHKVKTQIENDMRKAYKIKQNKFKHAPETRNRKRTTKRKKR